MAKLPQTLNVELLVSDVDFLGPCCSCREKEGVLKCSGCKAVAYCGQECQEKGWNDHKDVCNEINQLLQEVKAAVETLANEYGGIEALLESPLVKDGRFTFRDQWLSSEDPRNFRFENNRPTKPQEYEIARQKLLNSYARCGKEASSKLAFRLAAENLLHMLRLCRNGLYPYVREFTWYKYCGWMVAGEMDQQALNFLGYIQRRAGLSVPLDLDLSVQEDIEGLSVVNRVKENALSTFITPRFKVHYFMLISLIKYKRIKALRGEKERWNTFLEGTQSRSGESSVVLMLSGMAPVLEKLEGFVVDKAIGQRIDSLSNQVNGLLMEVNEETPKVIRGVLDKHVQMVDNPTLPEIDEDEIEYYSHYGYMDIPDDEREVHIARFAVKKYGHAWNIDNDCTRALRLFLETGNIMEAEEEGDSTPQAVAMEGDSTPPTVSVEGDSTPQTVAVEEVIIPEIEKVEAETSPKTFDQDDGEANLGATMNENAIKADEAVSDDEESEDINILDGKDKTKEAVSDDKESEDINILDGKDKTEKPSEGKKGKAKEGSGSIED